jgi:ATP/maltotriose-dependent transcriptional regulator MalT
VGAGTVFQRGHERGHPHDRWSPCLSYIRPRPILTDYPANSALCRGPGAGTEGAVTPTVTAMLAAMEACAHATHGDTPRCLKALSEAERALGRSNPAEDPGWLDFDEGGLAGHIARSLRDLNRPREAERLARRSIEVCHPQHRRTRMQRYAILATTHVQQGDLEGACAVGRQVLEEARGLSSTRTLDDVTHLVQLVSASRPNASAREFTEQARALLKPGRRPPPANRS